MKDPEFQKEFAERVFETLSVDDFQQLIQCPEDKDKIEEILKDYEFLKYTTDRAPTTIEPKKMSELMGMETASQKMAFFNYLFKTEMRKAASKRHRNKRAELHMEKIRAEKSYPPGCIYDPDTKEPIYKKWHNSLFMRILESDMAAVHDYKKRVAAVHGQPFILDFDYERYMQRREVTNTCDQVAILFGVNSRAPEPFDFWFCNYYRNSLTHERLSLALPNINQPNSLITLHEGSYLDAFPKERLVYLTPHAHHSLNKFSHDDIYIMAALVDKTMKAPVSLAKAKREGLRMARLPIDEHIIWGAYSKVLTLNQIVAIMLEVKNNGGDWKDALLKHVPRRKLKSAEDVQHEENARLEKLTFKRKNFFRLK